MPIPYAEQKRSRMLSLDPLTTKTEPEIILSSKIFKKSSKNAATEALEYGELLIQDPLFFLEQPVSFGLLIADSSTIITDLDELDAGMAIKLKSQLNEVSLNKLPSGIAFVAPFNKFQLTFLPRIFPQSWSSPCWCVQVIHLAIINC